MERFKACEKEMKTKAYSKEGLTNSTRLDPREKERAATVNFVSEMLEELEHQVEGLEAEQEMTRNSMKRGKKDTQKQERISELDDQLDRHRWHIGKMELILRMLENGTITAESVNSIQDDIRYYIESNQDPDFAEDEEIYDELNLDDDEDNLDSMIQEDLPGHSLEDLAIEYEREKEEGVSPTTSSQGNEKIVSTTPSSSGSVAKPFTAPVPATTTTLPLASATPAPPTIVPKESSSRKNTLSSILPSTVSSTVSGMKPAPPPARSTNELKYASAAAAAASSIPQGLAPLPPPAQSTPTTAKETPATTAPAANPVPPVVPTTQPASAWSNGTTASSSKSLWADKASDSKTEEEESKATTTQSTSSAQDSSWAAESKSPSLDGTEDKASSTSMSDSPKSFSGPLDAPIPSTPQVKLPPGLQDLVNSFDAAKQRIGTPPPIYSISKLLQNSYLNAPDFASEKEPEYYQPESPYPTPTFYPSEPLAGVISPTIFSKLDVDTLFYIFYYHQGSYQQYLAAKELKSRSWRFHKHFVTWFQRHEEPKTINNDYEQGTYRYFDFEGIWAQRRKQNFTFEYKYLEDEL